MNIEQIMNSTYESIMTLVMTNANAVFDDYFDVVVDVEILKSVLLADESLFRECMDNGIRDTDQRDMFMDAVLKAVGINMTWPCYGDTDAYAESFYQALAENKYIRQITQEKE